MFPGGILPWKRSLYLYNNRPHGKMPEPSQTRNRNKSQTPACQGYSLMCTPLRGYSSTARARYA